MRTEPTTVYQAYRRVTRVDLCVVTLYIPSQLTQTISFARCHLLEIYTVGEMGTDCIAAARRLCVGNKRP